MKKFVSALALWTFSGIFALADIQFRPQDLTVGESFRNPVGLNLENMSFSWKLPPIRKGISQSAYQIEVFDSYGKLLWNSAKVESNQSIKLPYGGRQPFSRERLTWRVRVWDENGDISEWSDTASFESGLLTNAEWKGKWISTTQQPEIFTEERKKGDSLRKCKILKLPPTLFRKEIRLGPSIKTARLYVTARGIYQIYVNGQKAGKDFWSPGWTDYDKRVQSVTYDVTSLVSEGKNAIGAYLAAGWYAGRLGWNFDACNYGTKPQLLAQLEIVYKDGSSAIIPTDETWKWAEGPVVYADIFDGEDYDARREIKAWNEANFDDSNWNAVAVESTGKTPLIEPMRSQPIIEKEVLHAISVNEVKPGTCIFDFGQNMVGWARINVPAIKGQKITIRFAEMLNADGSLYTDNYRTARSTDSYIPSGNSAQWEPSFTFHGFRYVELSGLPENAKPQIDWVKGVVLYNDIEQIGSFVCSNPKINRLQSNIQWGQRGNFFSVPTDCPQRDERMGWTGDAQVFCPTAAFNMNVEAFFSKWFFDIRDTQDPDGAYPDIAPMKNPKWKGGKAAWGDAGVICPWEIYLAYGNKNVLERNYGSMKRYIDYLKKSSNNFIRPEIGYGDWLQPNRPRGKSDASKAMIGTAYFARSADLASKTAKALGKSADAKEYARLASDVKDAFCKKYLKTDGTVENDCQTAYLLALAFDILPENMRAKSFEKLLAALKRDKWHLNTGFVGTPLLNPVLSRFGRSDIAYRLLNNETYPSWLYSVNQGATTMWERWNSYSHKDGFGDANMNSFNHYAYGAIGQWLYKDVAGIWRDDTIPGYKNIIFAPKPGGGLNFASASNATPYGAAASSWKISDGVMEWTVVIPPNATGTIVFPTANPRSIRVDGNRPAESSLTIKDGYPAMLKVPSGEYRILLRPDIKTAAK